MGDIQKLAMFVAVARTGSFTAAAAAETTSVGVVSRAIARLEQEYDCRLFNRTTRRVSLTAEGEQFLEWVEAAILNLRNAKDRLSEHRKSLRGTLKVLVAAYFAKYCLMEHLPPFLAANPELRLEIHTQDDGLDPIKGGFDVVFQLGLPVESGYICRRLGDIEVILAANADYIDRMGKPRTLAELAKHSCIGSRLASTHRAITPWRMVNAQTGKITLFHPKSSLVFSGQIDVTLDAALAGLGILPIGMKAATPYLKANELVRVLPDYRNDVGTLYAIYPHRDHIPFKVRAFIDLVAEVARSTLYQDPTA